MAEETEKGRDLALDRALAARIRAGEEEAFEELVTSNHRQVSRISGRFFRRAEIVEEIVQDVFLKAFLAIGDYRGEVPLAHWLSRIAVNACYDQLRKRQPRRELTVSQIAEDVPDFYERLAARDGSPEAAFWDREEARLLAEQLLSRLAPADRIVLTLTVLEDLSVAEVSKLTGWSQANVKIRAFRARGRMRKLLAAGPGSSTKENVS